MAEVEPFTGERPDITQVRDRLGRLGFAGQENVRVFVPMDGSDGPLAEKLTECRSADLNQGWPNMFKAIVGGMIKDNSRRGWR